MNLSKKKKLAARTLNVGLGRIVFADSRKGEIKEAITKQDIRDLVNSGAIYVKDKKGKRKSSRKKRSGPGKIRMSVNRRKKNYVSLTRKLRGYLSALKKEGRISAEEFGEARKGIRNGFFKSKSHLKSHIATIKNK